MESPNKCPVNSGFTLVELSIVMIIIGLLIGGIFGGMKLVDNANVQKTVQDLKSFDAAGLTFKDIYRALPGDMRNPDVRLPSCAAGSVCAPNAAPNTGGNGDRKIGGDIGAWPAITVSDEKFIFWQHLLAAGLIAGVKPSDDLNFSEGQPETPVGGGYRNVGFYSGLFWGTNNISSKHLLWMSDKYSDSFAVATSQNQDSIPCRFGRQLDSKMDDNMPNTGRLTVWGSCNIQPNSPTSNWQSSGTEGAILYVLAY